MNILFNFKLAHQAMALKKDDDREINGYRNVIQILLAKIS